MLQKLINIDSSSYNTLVRVVDYYKAYKRHLWLVVVALLAFSIVDAGMIYFVQPLIDKGLNNADQQLLRLMAAGVIGVFILRGLFSFIANFLVAYVSTRITETIRGQVFKRIQYLPLSFFQRHSRGELVAKITYDSEQLAKAILDSFVVLVRESGIILVLMAIMFHASWQLSLIFLLIVPLVSLAIKWVSKRFKRLATRLQSSVGQLAASLEQSIYHHRDVLAFNAQQQEIENFSQVNKHSRQQQMKLAATHAVSNPVIQLFASLALSLVLLLASYPNVLTELTPGTFITTLIAMGSLLRPIKQLTQLNQTLQRGLVAAQGLFALADEPCETTSGTDNIPRDVKQLSLRHLSFCYPGESELSLNDLSLNLDAGEPVAILGHSGSGKSSLVNLLLNFYPSKQAIFIDDKPIESFSLWSLRNSIALVSQQISLTNNSIHDNIAYGDVNKFSSQQIEQAAEAALVTEFAQQLPQGLNAIVGENGCLLSGGQRQRVAIARALVRNSPVLILDEPTSALDSHTERRVIENIFRLRADKITLLITHNERLAQLCSHSYQLANGNCRLMIEPRNLDIG